MGRNDTRGMVAVFILKALAAALLFLLAAGGLNAQNRSGDKPVKGEKEKFTFKVLQRYTPGRAHVYHYSQKDTVIRVFSDDSEKRFQRQVDYFFTIVAEEGPEDGFINVDVKIDSMRYRMEEGNAVFSYNSQEEIGSTGIEFDDMEKYNVPLGRMFEMTLSPYGEATEFKGENLKWIRDYVEDGKEMISEKKYFMWMDGLSDNNLAHLADVRKIEVPLGFLKIDTTWQTPVDLRIGGYDFSGETTALIKDYETAAIFITAGIDSLSLVQKRSQFYAIKEMVDITDAKIENSSMEVIINHLGTVDMTLIKAEAVLDAAVKQEYFKEYIFTEMKWELIGRYKY